jgi:hypothetical protein
LRFGDPVAVIFNAEDPEYYDLTPNYTRFRGEINQLIQDKLNTDFKGSETDFLKLLESLLSKFSNGKYFLNLQAENVYHHTIRTAEWNNDEFQLMELVFGKIIDPKQEERIPVKESLSETTTNICEPFNEEDNYSYSGRLPILTTKPEGDMDSKTVRYFEEQIRKKERPLILLFHAFCEGEYWDVPYILLDGHHKFKAYQNLGVIPRIAIISRAFSVDTVRFMPDQLIDYLYPWQNRYVFSSFSF